MPKTIKTVEDYSTVITKLEKDFEALEVEVQKHNNGIPEGFENYKEGFSDCISMVTDYLFDHFFGKKV